MATGSKIKINMDSLKSRREWKRFKVKDGNNVFRILPPFGDSSNGYVFKKWQVIWGLKDPDSNRMRPFASSMTSEKRCPVTEYVSQLKKKAEQIKAQLQASGESDDLIKERLKSLNQLISDLSPKTVYIYNAVDKSGDVGLLELKSTAHKKMKDAMAQYISDYQQDPTSLNSEDDDSGVWFNVKRSGMGRDTEYDVEKCQHKTKKPTGGYSYDDDRSPLPETVVNNFENLAYDLSSVYQLKTYEDLERILEVNLPEIIENFPDADLNNESLVETVVTKTASAPVAQNKPVGKKPVNLRLDDEDEDEEVITVSTKKSTSFDDDFLAEADALLNS